MRRCVIALFFLTLSPSATAQEKLLDEIYGRFSHITGASADFTEVKKTKAFKKDQIQKGKFSSSRTGELTWEVLEPVRSTFTVKGDTARVTYPDMDYEKTYDLKKDAGIGTVVKNIFAVVGATGSASLKESYEYAVEGSWKDGWKITLVPRSKKVRKVIKKIILTVTKKDFITSIRIIEGGGDSTDITFTNIKLKKKSSK